jgi:hypothetical protein
MNARCFLAVALSSSLLVMACGSRSSRAVSAPRPAEPAIEHRPPPGTPIDTWPDLGGWSATGKELPGSRDLFLWEKASALPLPKAQVPLRLHRPVE